MGILLHLFLLAQAADAVKDQPMFDNSAIGQILIFLGVVLSTVVSFITQARTHRWDVEDRERIKEELRVRMQQEEDARARVAADLKSELSKTRTELESNTQISRDAFKEANTVNQKIAALGKMFDSVRSQDSDKISSRLSGIEKTTTVTQELVKQGVDAVKEGVDSMRESEKVAQDTNERVRQGEVESPTSRKLEKIQTTAEEIKDTTEEIKDQITTPDKKKK